MGAHNVWLGFATYNVWLGFGAYNVWLGFRAYNVWLGFGTDNVWLGVRVFATKEKMFRGAGLACRRTWWPWLSSRYKPEVTRWGI